MYPGYIILCKRKEPSLPLGRFVISRFVAIRRRIRSSIRRAREKRRILNLPNPSEASTQRSRCCGSFVKKDTKKIRASLESKDHKLSRVPLEVSYSCKARIINNNNSWKTHTFRSTRFTGGTSIGQRCKGNSRDPHEREGKAGRYSINTRWQCSSFDGDTNDRSSRTINRYKGEGKSVKLSKTDVSPVGLWNVSFRSAGHAHSTLDFNDGKWRFMSRRRRLDLSCVRESSLPWDSKFDVYTFNEKVLSRVLAESNRYLTTFWISIRICCEVLTEGWLSQASQNKWCHSSDECYAYVIR